MAEPSPVKRLGNLIVAIGLIVLYTDKKHERNHTMRSLNSICRARDEARYISRSWSSSKPVEPVDGVSKIMPDADETYGSQANKDLWYQLEVRKITGGKLFTPEIVHVADIEFNRVNGTLGTYQFNYQFSLHSNPEDLLQYIDRNVYTVEYKGELV